MRNFIVMLVLVLALATGCNKKTAADAQPAFTADIRILTPFTQPPVQNGKLYMSKGRLRVELGPMADVYIVAQKRGWRMFPESKSYMNIGKAQVSTYLPPMTNGSPCPSFEQPSACRMVGRENIEGRPATKWELVNHHGAHVYLWMDDKLEIAVRWQIENVTYEVKGIRDGAVTDSMFELPSGYAALPSDMGRPDTGVNSSVPRF